MMYNFNVNDSLAGLDNQWCNNSSNNNKKKEEYINFIKKDNHNNNVNVKMCQ